MVGRRWSGRLRKEPPPFSTRSGRHLDDDAGIASVAPDFLGSGSVARVRGRVQQSRRFGFLATAGAPAGKRTGPQLPVRAGTMPGIRSTVYEDDGHFEDFRRTRIRLRLPRYRRGPCEDDCGATTLCGVAAAGFPECVFVCAWVFVLALGLLVLMCASFVTPLFFFRYCRMVLVC